MKRFAMWAVLMLCAGTAFGQTVGTWGQSNRQPSNATSPSVPTVKILIIGGVNGSDTTWVPARFDANGSLQITDPSRDRNNYEIDTVCDDSMSVAQFIDAKSTKGQTFTAESSAVIPCYMFHHFTIGMRVIPVAGDTTSHFRFAVQVRKHTDATGDSASTFAWSEWSLNGSTPTADSLQSDSTGHFRQAQFWGGTGHNQGVSPWSNERLVVLDAERGNALAVANSINQSFGWPGGIAMDLIDGRGQWFWAPYISIRIRCLSANAAASKPRVIAKLMMGS